MVFEPPQRDDDTQPNRAFSETQPKRPNAKQPRWVFLLLMLFSAFTLVMTVRYLFTETSPQTDLTLNMMQVYIEHYGDTRSVISGASTVADVLDEQNIVLGTNDRVTPELDTALSDGLQIVIEQLRTITIIIDDTSTDYQTTLLYPVEILQANQIDLVEDDRIWIDGTRATLDDITAWTVPVSEIIIEHALAITVQDGTETRNFITHAETVGDALYEAGYTLYVTDIITPAIDQALTQNMVNI